MQFSNLTTVNFSNGDLEPLPFDLNSPILLSVDEYQKGIYECVFEQFLSMPLGCTDPTSSNVTLVYNKALFAELNGTFSPSINLIEISDYVYCSIYVEGHNIVTALRKTSSLAPYTCNYLSIINLFEKKLSELQAKEPNPDIIAMNQDLQAEGKTGQYNDFDITLSIRLRNPKSYKPLTIERYNDYIIDQKTKTK